MKTVLKLGTRRSLLAVAQSTWVAKEVERLNPGIQVELVGIDTKGDKIQNLPLQKVEGKDFFVAELDHALISRQVDFTVHSMKDLSLTRPSEIICAAIPKRENPRDVILFGPHIMSSLKMGKPIKIGTSSPRRLENIPAFLERALPAFSEKSSPRSQLQWEEIRGNVNTRLGRLHEPETSSRYLDGVVLAFAGLIRLWADSEGQNELRKLLSGVRWMVLPLKQCPAAPAQGALSIECRKDNPSLLSALRLLHCELTAQQVAVERELLLDWGGGCHQRFGATARIHQELGEILYIRGVKQNSEFVEQLRWSVPPFAGQKSPVSEWNGSQWRQKISEEIQAEIKLPHEKECVFIAHSRAAWKSDALQAALRQKRVWTSGVESWFKLAQKGIWVEGCAENLGFSSLVDTLNERVLQLAPLNQWFVLTHEEGKEDWAQRDMEVLGAYGLKADYDFEAKSALQKATHLFWSSGSQFDELKEWVSSESHHACGPGKTAQHLRRAGLIPTVFPSVEEWKKWLKLHCDASDRA